MDKIIQIVTGIFSERSTRQEGQDDLVGLSQHGRVYISECGNKPWELLCEPPKLKLTRPKEDVLAESRSDLPKPTEMPPFSVSKGSVQVKKERPVFGNYPCDICEYPFDTQAAMTRHKLKRHENPHTEDVIPRGTIAASFKTSNEAPLNVSIVDCSNPNCGRLKSFVKNAGYRPDESKQDYEFCNQRCFEEFKENLGKLDSPTHFSWH